MCDLNLMPVLWEETRPGSSLLCLQMPIDKKIFSLVCFCDLSGENEFAPAKEPNKKAAADPQQV